MDAPRLFHLTGGLSNGSLLPIERRALRPALFARFRDPARLRYDFPLVLADGGHEVMTLSGMLDLALDEVAPDGPQRVRARRLFRKVEREIRAVLADGTNGTIDALWDAAVSRLAAREGDEIRLDLAPLRSAVRIEGELADCDAALPARLVTHLWRAVEAQRATALRRDIDSLVARLSQLVRADFARSEAGRTAPALRAGIGAPHQALFDFEAMARLLAKPSGPIGLSESKLRRIAAALAVLKKQRFVGDGAWSFEFHRVDIALAAFQERLPILADVVRAMSIAELELAGAYAEVSHDPFFAAFDETALAPDDVARFPSYLVLLRSGDGDTTTHAPLMDALTSGAPVKVLLETDDVFGLGGRLATTAVGLGDVFVVQSASAGLFRETRRVRAAIEYPGAALLSVFSGARDARHIPPYLVAAAAIESRAFPTFTYDPTAGPDLAGRLSLDGAPQPDRPWPVHALSYADDELQRVDEPLTFTPVDFALCDPALTGRFAELPRSAWTSDLRPAAEFLGGPIAADAIPFVWAVGTDDRLRRLVVDERLLRVARRLSGAWTQLCEMAGPRTIPAPVAPPIEPAVAVAPVAVAPVAVASETLASATPASDDPYIETPRCTTCNECTTLNGRMFAYNENRQAYVADPAAGTYRELVEAAEGCQVAIIHPGKPRDPNEPGLAELVARAAAFL